MELSVAIQAKVEVTPSNWNFGFQPTKNTFFCILSFLYADLSVFFVRLSLDNYFPQRNNAGY